MFKFFIFLIIYVLSLNALELQINSSNFDLISQKLSSEKNIQKLTSEERVPYSTLQSLKVQNSKDGSKSRNDIQREYAKLKMLLIYLSPNTNKSEIKDKLREAFFRRFVDKNEKFSFIYKISYTNGNKLNGDKIFEILQKKISLYILNKYGISNIEDNLLLSKKGVDISTQNYTMGTVESDPKNNFDSYQYGEKNTIRSGVISFIFYPFTMVKRNQHTLEDNNLIDNNKMSIKFSEIINKDKILQNNLLLNSDDNKKLKKFIMTNIENKKIDLSRIVTLISNKTIEYTRIAKTLFDSYPNCHILACLDKTIKMKLDSFSDIKKSKIYSYDIALSNDDDFEYIVLPAFRKLSKYLKRDTQINSFEDSEILNGKNFSENTKESKIIPIVKKIIIRPYIKNLDKLGLHFDVYVSFTERDVCSQYYVGVSHDTLFGMKFIKLKTKNNKIIEMAQTELTNKIFNKILPYAKRDDLCQKSFSNKEPVNCVSYALLDKLLSKLNRSSKKYRYRFPTCKEDLFFATCGGKQKFCWGNSTDFNQYEFLRKNKDDNLLKPVATKKANFLKLYDFCGNILEYCVDKYGYYKTFGSTQEHLQAKIFNESYSDVSGIRLVREKK